MLFVRIVFLLVLFLVSLISLSGSGNMGTPASIILGILLVVCVETLVQLVIRIPRKKLFLAIVAILVGLFVARQIGSFILTGSHFLNIDLSTKKFLVPWFRVSLGLSCIYLSLVLFMKKYPEIANLLDSLSDTRTVGGAPKIIDTSVIIDGRIYDLFRTGFVEGAIIIPKFILEELQQIADSSDSIKRARGRRGLDILNSMRKEMKDRVQIVDDDYDDIREPDSKLVRVAQERRGQLLTNDFNLNKIAELQRVRVLNINELANALKPVAISGEELKIKIIKEGKDPGQGVGYLADGTMVVVENARRLIGKEVRVVVTTLHQTSAGRMVFAQLK